MTSVDVRVKISSVVVGGLKVELFSVWIVVASPIELSAVETSSLIVVEGEVASVAAGAVVVVIGFSTSDDFVDDMEVDSDEASEVCSWVVVSSSVDDFVEEGWTGEEEEDSKLEAAVVDGSSVKALDVLPLPFSTVDDMNWVEEVTSSLWKVDVDSDSVLSEVDSVTLGDLVTSGGHGRSFVVRLIVGRVEEKIDESEEELSELLSVAVIDVLSEVDSTVSEPLVDDDDDDLVE